MANVIGAGCSESLPTTAAPTSQDRNPLNLENTSWTCWSWIQQPWTDTSMHSWAVLNILRPHCTTARACSVAALSLLVVILQGAMLHLLQHEAYFPACSAQASCPLGTACTYHPSGLRCTPCQVRSASFAWLDLFGIRNTTLCPKRPVCARPQHSLESSLLTRDLHTTAARSCDCSGLTATVSPLLLARQ